MMNQFVILACDPEEGVWSIVHQTSQKDSAEKFWEDMPGDESFRINLDVSNYVVFPPVEPEDVRPKCSLCQRRRYDGSDGMDNYDYSPMQVISGQPLGWYSGDDGEVCPSCMNKTIRGQ